MQEGLEPYFLDTQFRSHPKLVEWVASSIYGGRLKSRSLSWVLTTRGPRNRGFDLLGNGTEGGIADGARPPMKGFDWPRKKAPTPDTELLHLCLPMARCQWLSLRWGGPHAPWQEGDEEGCDERVMRVWSPVRLAQVHQENPRSTSRR